MFPPRLVLRLAKAPSQDCDEASAHSASRARPNLMPFSIDYTGPANVDGYLITTKAGGREGSDDEFSHFRGRRIFNTVLSLPSGWVGCVCSLAKGVTLNAPEFDRTTLSLTSTMDCLQEEGTSCVAEDFNDREEKLRLLEKRRKRIKTAAAPIRAAMASFPMDDDDDDADQVSPQDEIDADREISDLRDGPSDGYSEETDPYRSEPMHDSAAVRAIDARSIDVRSNGHERNEHTGSQDPVNLVQPLRLRGNLTTFEALNVWNPDGKLDAGDDEFVKVFREYSSLVVILHSTAV